MSKDRLLRKLGQVAREEREAEQGRFDERWDHLAAGELSADEEAQLRALAEASPEAREAVEAFQPLGAEFQAHVVDAITAALAGQAPEAEDRKRRSRLPPFWVAAAGTAAAAAALFLVLRQPPSLPVYTAELSLGDRPLRGTAGPSSQLPVFGPSSLLTFVARPRHTVTGSVDARCFFTRDADLGSWQPGPDPELEDGAVRLRGRQGQEIRLPPGEWRVWIVVGRPGKIPPMEELLAELRAGRTRGERWRWQAVSRDLRVEDRWPP